MDEKLSISKPVVKNYEGNNISFFMGGNVMVNATEMAKSFGKVAKDWLRTGPAQEFIASLSAVRHICPSQLVVVQKGNSSQFEQGTWMHEDVALEFARWLSPKFAIWCNDRIKELLTKGHISLPDFSDPVAAARAWADEKEKAMRLEAVSQEQQKRIDKQQPYVDFALEAFQSESKVDIGQAAKILHLPFGRNTLFKRLREDGVFFRDRNEPLQKYIDAEYFIVTQLKPIYTESGREIINVKVFCTQKGIAYLNLKYGAGVREVPAPIKQPSIY